jgi:hypothetical protein
MAAYNVFIIDPFNEIKPIVSVCFRLKELFDPIAKQAGYDEASFFFPQYRTVKPDAHEMMIYVCPFTCSVVKRMPGVDQLNFPYTSSGSHQGVTWVGQNMTASEIWCNFAGGVDFYAAMIFHELMHNKLQMGQRLHGNFTPCGMSCASITPSASNTATQAEIDAMAKALKNPVTQWTGGQALLWGAADSMAAQDPMWNSSISAA